MLMAMERGMAMVMAIFSLRFFFLRFCMQLSMYVHT